MDRILRRMLLLLYNSLFIITPLLMYHKTSELFEFNKMLFIYCISSAIGAVWLSRMIIHKKLIIKNSLFTWPILLFVASQVVSTIFSIDKLTSVFGYYGRFNGGLLSIFAYALLYFAFISNFSTQWQAKNAIKQFLTSSLIGSVLVILWGLPSRFGYDLSCLVFTGKLDVACWTDQFKPTIRTFSTLGQPNWLGAYLVINFFIGLNFLLTNLKEKRHLFLYSLYIASNVIMVLFTRSRSSLLALAAGCAIVFIFLIFTYRKSISVSRNKLLIGGAVIVLVATILIVKTGVIPIDSLVRGENMNSEQQTAQNEITDSFTIRKIVWQGGYVLGLQHPLFGTGVETFAYAYNFVRPIAHNMTTEWDFVYNKAHNEFVNYFATTGAIGLFAYLLMIGVVVSQGVHIFKSHSLKLPDKLLLASLIGAYISILVTNFFGFSITVTNMYLFVIPAVIIFCTTLSQMPKHDNYEKNINLTSSQQIFLGIVAIACGSMLWYVVSYWRADMHFAKGDSYSSMQDYGNSISELYKAYNLRKEPIYADKISAVLAQITLLESTSGKNEEFKCPSHDQRTVACPELVEEYSKAAIQQSPKNVYFYRTLSRNYIILYQANRQEANFDKAIDAMKMARQLSPSNPHYPYTQALFYLAKYENTKKPSKEDAKELELSGLSAANFAIELKKDYRDAYYAKGLILKQLGMKDEARKTYNNYMDTYGVKDEDMLKELTSF